MKRISAIILALIMMLSIISCSRNELIVPSETAEAETGASGNDDTQTEEAGIHVSDGVYAAGFGRRDFSPYPGVPMGGFGNAEQRPSGVVKDKVMATCVAIKDTEGNIALNISCDLCNIAQDVAQYCREAINKKHNIPVENIYLSCTHTHSGPTTASSSPATQNWKTTFYKAVKGAADDSIADLDKCEAYIGNVETEGLNFVRRYVDASGKYIGNNTNNGVAHETEADHTLQIIKFARENQKDIVVLNFPCHATFVGTSTGGDVSADFIGYLRKKLEKTDDVLCEFFQGASGNVVPSTHLSGEKAYKVKDHGEMLAKYASEALPNLQKVEMGTIKAEERTLEIAINHSRDNEAANAKIVYDVLEVDLAQANSISKQYGFTDAYDARDVYQRSRMGATRKMNIGAIACGDIAFTWVPYEMFDTNGDQVKSGSPFSETFVCELANSGHSYIPSLLGFKNGGYEVRSCLYVEGTGEMVADQMVDILNKLK